MNTLNSPQKQFMWVRSHRQCMAASTFPSICLRHSHRKISAYSTRSSTTAGAGYQFVSIQNPTRSAFEKVMAAVEYGKYSIAFSSGCGAMTSILHLLKTGDHLIACDDVYGGTQRYMRLFTK